MKLQTVRFSSSLSLISRAHTPNFSLFLNGQVRRGVDWDRTTYTEDRISSSVDLAEMIELTVEQQDSWVKESAANSEGLTLIDQEKRAQEQLQAHPVVFECIYCKSTDDSLKYLKQHVFGRRRTAKSRFLENPCSVRAIEEGLNPGKVPITSKPKKFPWANVICRDLTGYKRSADGQMVFSVSPKIRQEWANLIIDERGSERTGEGKGRPMNALHD